MKVVQNIFGDIDRLIEERKLYSREPVSIHLDCYDLPPLFRAIAKSERITLRYRESEKYNWRPVNVIDDTIEIAQIWQVLISGETTSEKFCQYINKFHSFMRDNANFYSLIYYKGFDAFDRYPGSYPIILNLE